MAHSTANIMIAPRTKPTRGESTIGRMTLSTMLPHCTTPPLAKRVAPTRPPNSAWDEDDGMPKYQVIRFHTMAPRTPANTTPRLSRPVGRVTRPSPTVFATLAPRWAPTKLPSAAMISATRGVNARVDTEVAMAFAAS